MDRRALDLAAVGGITARRVRIILGVNLGNVAIFILFAARAGDEIRALESALGAVRRQALVLGYGDLHKVVRLDPALAGEGDLMRAGGGIGRVVLDREGLALALGIVRDDELHRMKNTHRALGLLVEVFAQAVLEEAVLNHARALGNADAVAEIADGRGRETAAAQTAQRRHTRIVPALLHELAELALRHDRVVDAKAGKLDLARLAGHGNIVHDPVVERAVRLKLQRAQRVRDALERVLNGVRKVVHRVDAPLVALTVMVHVADAVNNRVAHVEVAGG